MSKILLLENVLNEVLQVACSSVLFGVSDSVTTPLGHRYDFLFACQAIPIERVEDDDFLAIPVFESQDPLAVIERVTMALDSGGMQKATFALRKTSEVIRETSGRKALVSGPHLCFYDIDESGDPNPLEGFTVTDEAEMGKIVRDWERTRTRIAEYMAELHQKYVS